MPHHAGDLQLVIALNPERVERIAQLLRLQRPIGVLTADDVMKRHR